MNKKILFLIIFTVIFLISPRVTFVAEVDAAGPLRVNPANPRYFTDNSGNSIFLTGYHTWDSLQDLENITFDWNAYLNLLTANGQNFIRLWILEQAKGLTTWPDPAYPDQTFKPEIYLRTGPGTAADGGLKFDLTKYNQTFLNRIRQRVIDSGNRGMYVSIMLFNGWSIEQKAGGSNPWVHHPYNKNNNINNINGDPNNNQRGTETHTLQISTITQAQEAFVRKVIDTVNDLDNVLYEISNESNSDSIVWQQHMIDFIHNYETTKPKQHPVGMTIPSSGVSNDILFASRADWISPNVGSGYKDNPPVATGKKVILSDTDHLWGIGGDRYWAWKSFTRGINLLYMDPWEGYFLKAQANPNVRTALNYVGSYARRINLNTMTPSTTVSSTQYALAKAGSEYLVYQPNSGAFTVTLGAGTYSVEWFNPATGVKTSASSVSGGSTKSFTPPFSGDAVLYLKQTNQTQTPTPTPTTSPPAGGKPGDANRDNRVDGLDYIIWLTHYGQNVSGVNNGNFNGDGRVDGLDYVVWLTNYGK